MTCFKALKCTVLLLALGGCAEFENDGDVRLSPLASARVQLQPTEDARAVLLRSGVSESAFGDAIRAAVTSHPDAMVSQLRIDASSARQEGANGVYQPQISMGFEAVATAGSSGAGNSAGPVLNLSQLVYDGGAALRGNEAERERVAQATADFAVSSSALALAAVQAHVDVWRARQMHTNGVANLRAINGYLGQINDRLLAGAGTEAERILGQSRRATARSQLVEMAQAKDRAEADYVEIFDEPSAQTLRLPPPAPATNGRGSPQLVSLDFAINAALLDLERARANRLPNLSLGLSTRPTVNQGAFSADVRAQIGVSYTLSSGGQRQAAIREAEAVAGTLQAQRASLSRKISRALSVARSDSTAARDRIEAARLTIRANQAALRATQDQVNIGRREISALLDAQRDLSSAQNALVSAEADQALQGYAVLGVTGEILTLFDIPGPELRLSGLQRE